MSITTLSVVGSHTAGAGFVVLHTTPAGYHERWRELLIEANANDTVALQIRRVSGPPTVRVVPDLVLAANVPVPLSWWLVMEAGDLLLFTGVAGGTTIQWWLSGTRYSN